MEWDEEMKRLAKEMVKLYLIVRESFQFKKNPVDLSDGRFYGKP